jgi:hypothetical protein
MIESQSLTTSQMAEEADCSKPTIKNIRRNLQQFGSVHAPPTRVGRRCTVTPLMLEALCDHLLEKSGLGDAVDHPGLRLRLSDFTYKELAQKEMGDEDTDIYISGIQLCQYLDAADSKGERALGERSLAKEVKRRKRSETPPEAIRVGDEARYAEQEERAVKRTDHDMDY